MKLGSCCESTSKGEAISIQIWDWLVFFLKNGVLLMNGTLIVDFSFKMELFFLVFFTMENFSKGSSIQFSQNWGTITPLTSINQKKSRKNSMADLISL